MEKKLDLRGFSCPIPLMKTRDALTEADMVTVVVDEAAAKENIIKFAKSQRYQAECSGAGSEFTIVIKK
jgi:TusA-related sulfurtransferase